MKPYSLPEFSSKPDAASRLNMLVRVSQDIDIQEVTGRFAAIPAEVHVHPEQEYRVCSLFADALDRDRFLEEAIGVVEEFNRSARPPGQLEIIETRLVSSSEKGCSADPRCPSNPPLLSEYDLVLDHDGIFGSGFHPSTQLAVRAMEDLCRIQGRPPFHVLDVGCGSGVLALISARLGAARILGLDIDAEALKMARENVAANNLAGTVTIEGTPLTQVSERFDLILANLIPSVMQRMLGDLVKILKGRGNLVLSGMQGRKAEEFAGLCGMHGMRLVGRYEDGPWRALLLQMNP